MSAGGGVKVQLAPHLQLRVELHDYLTPFPKQVITPQQRSQSRLAGCRISCRWSASATRRRKVAKPPKSGASRRERVARDLPKAGSFSFIEW